MSNQGLFALKAETLSHLDMGRASAALDQAIKKAVLDCLDRPGDDRPRKVTMTLELKPVMEVVNQSITCEGCTGQYAVRLRTPDWSSNKLDFGVRQNGTLVFNEHSPANHRQTTIFDNDEDEGDGGKD